MKIIIVTLDKEEIELVDWKKEILDVLYEVFGDDIQPSAPADSAKDFQPTLGFRAGITRSEKAKGGTKPAKATKGRRKSR